MNASLWSFWTTAQPALAGLKAGDWALLIMLGASLLVLSALREKYLLVWTAGWALLVSSRLALVHGAALRIPARDVTAFVQAAFVAAAGLFAGAVLVYIRERNLLLPLAVASAIVAGSAVARGSAAALRSGSFLPNHSADRSHRTDPRPQRALGILGMAAGDLSAGAAPQLAAVYRRDSSQAGCRLRCVAGAKHVAGSLWRSPRTDSAFASAGSLDR